MTAPQLQRVSAADAANLFDEILRTYTTVYADSQTEEDFANFRGRGAAVSPRPSRRSSRRFIPPP